MAIKSYPVELQSPANLMRSATMARDHTAVVTPVPKALLLKPQGLPGSGPSPQASGSSVSFFFDGTGNNMDADLKTGEHSNVVRLYRAHQEDDPSHGRFRIYIPGVGTYFKEVGDSGGTTRGKGFGAMGEDRLEWAMKKLIDRASKGTGVMKVALFGFSRGATLARAFARRIAERCTATSGGWSFKHDKGKRDIRLYFMGLFDTVASVGIPMSTNNEPARGLSIGLLSLEQAMKNRQAFDASLEKIAFGDAPGADPAPGVYDGHQAWGDGLAIPKMVEQCVHMVAAHEIRNSFPLDSLLQSNRYPAGCSEIVYPGAHSDVGGGYRLGEGARSTEPGSQLSMLPLRYMREKALQAGVPLAQSPSTDDQKKDFALDSGSQIGISKLQRRFNYYIQHAGAGGKPLGQMMLSHMKLYYQWRFYKIAVNQNARKSKTATLDEQRLKESEKTWSAESKKLWSDLEELESEIHTHEILATPTYMGPYATPTPLSADQKMHIAEASKLRDKYLALKARYDTLPSSDGSLAKNLAIYDAQLLAEARLLQKLAATKGRTKLRPHYKALLEAYEAEYDQKKGLRDKELIGFFDDYVHDSLAGFALDATLPSDPRVIYIGGDDKMQYAMNSAQPQGSPFSTVA